MRPRSYPLTCGFQFDRHDPRVRPCKGKLRSIEGVRVCERHWAIIEQIKADACPDKRRHPVHRARTAA